MKKEKSKTIKALWRGIEKDHEKRHKKMMSMNPEDFKKCVVDGLLALEKYIYTVVDTMSAESRKQLMECAKTIGKGLKERDKDTMAAFKTAHERIHTIESFLLLSTVADRLKHGTPMSEKEKNNLASMLSIDWQATVKEFEGPRNKLNA